MSTVTETALSGREARCHCGKTKPSLHARDNEAFFEFRGEGSTMATDRCKHCRYAECAHLLPKNPNPRAQWGVNACKGFEPHGAWEFDSFFCGCTGWD